MAIHAAAAPLPRTAANGKGGPGGPEPDFDSGQGFGPPRRGRYSAVRNLSEVYNLCCVRGGMSVTVVVSRAARCISRCRGV